MNLTKAEVLALRDVKAGRVERIYRENGNILKSSTGTSAKVLWALDRKGFIKDGPDTRGGFWKYCTMRLTNAGESALRQAGE